MEFGIVQPSLIQQLKSILDQYQDDGQILKELIQNAEDARATEVKFLLDERCHPAQHLVCPELSQFQGPALYAFNNSCFEDRDWRGIRLLNDSVKKEDPTKVGRFGLGFKSVFHLTDLPSVVSGDKVCILDPNEKYFEKDGRRTTGYGWNLREDKEKIESICDQFLPYVNVFGDDTDPVTNGNFPGTLFRFPLRQQRSPLSDNIYEVKKVNELFRSFETAAKLVLIFLMSVERIELYRRPREGPLELVFKVQVLPDLAPAIRVKRIEFMQAVHDENGRLSDISTTFLLEVESSSMGDSQESSQRETYLVSHYCRKEEQVQVREGREGRSLLMLANKLKYVAWSSTAALLPDDDSEPKDFFVKCDDLHGQIFCFLPLPLQRDSPTGLPVHVNGFFALSSSRHQVKWPSIDSGDVTDDACLWNQHLLDEVLPRAYVNLLKEALEIVRKKMMPGLTRCRLYSLVPDAKLVTERWKCILRPLFDLLFREAFVYVHSDEGTCWEHIGRTLLPDPTDDLPIRGVIARCLAKAAASSSVAYLACVPLHVLEAAKEYVLPLPKPADPPVLRQALRQVPEIVHTLSDSECLMLLDFVLRDENYDDLEGLPLLPLSDGTFTVFSNASDARPIYMSREILHSSLLPQCPQSFLDVSSRVKGDTLKKLGDAAAANKMQLRVFNEHVFEKMLSLHLKSSDISQGQYGETIWGYLLKYFSKEFAGIEGLPLILGKQQESRFTYAVYPLSRDKPVLTLKQDHAVLSDSIRHVIERLGISIIEETPAFIWTHPLIPGSFIFPPSAHGVLSVLCANAKSDTSIFKRLEELTSEEKRALREYLARLDGQGVTHEQLQFLGKMPVFEFDSKSCIFTSAERAKAAAPPQHPLLPDACNLIDIHDTASQMLAALLNVPIINRSTLFLDHLIPIISEQRCTLNEAEEIMIDVLLNLDSYQKENGEIIGHLKRLPFVHRPDGKRVTPAELFDPKCEILREMLYGEDVFPARPFDRDEILAALRQLGLRNVAGLQPADLSTCVRKICELYSSGTKISRSNIVQKSMALLSYLEDCRDIIDGRLPNDLRECAWIAPLDAPTHGYPSNLLWHGAGAGLATPGEVFTLNHAETVGSAAPVLRRHINSSLSSYFEWNKLPSLNVAIRHFKNVITSYRSNEKGSYLNIVRGIYSIFCDYGDDDVLTGLSQEQITKWVWYGDGFVSPENCVLSQSRTDFRPYLFEIPAEVQEYAKLFVTGGAHKECNGDVLLNILHMVKDKYASTSDSTFDGKEVSQDLDLVVTCIELLASSNHPSSVRDRLLLPIAVNVDNSISLMPVSECTYCETQWLLESTPQSTDEAQEKIFFVHSRISTAVAKQFGVPSLMNRTLCPDDLLIGEGFGQSEPLTLRLKNLLEAYKDGFAVPKELIQNADDAGATEVKFLYDERTNNDALTCLIDTGMRECQGPALWVYNNAVFTDKDFDNIVKLGAATKSSEADKIGCFGLGFNAVYNLTDVPSFVSREFIVIFDPHATHLGAALPDRSKPGIKVDMVKNSRILQVLHNQFKPYHGVFGCYMLPSQGTVTHFNGTLFRLPLRTKDQAAHSEISRTAYDGSQVKELLQLLAKSCHSLLLFTQNVSTVSVHHISPDGTPRDAKELFSISKAPMQFIRELQMKVKVPCLPTKLTKDQEQLRQNSNILRASSKVMELQSKGDWKRALPETSIIMSVRYRQTTEGCDLLSLQEEPLEATQEWLVVTCMASDEALTFSLEQKQRTLSPIGGVAVCIANRGKKEFSIGLEDDDGNGSGRLFCFLPLPIRTGLPVHINGGFIVTSDRQRLSQQSQDEKHTKFGNWNCILMEDAIAKAYVNLLEDVRDMLKKGELSNKYIFHQLWPEVIQVASDVADCSPLVKSIYRRIAGYCNSANVAARATAKIRFPLLFSDGVEWADIGRVIFMDVDMATSEIADAATDALRVYAQAQKQRLLVVNLPSSIIKGFTEADCSVIIKEHMYDRHRLYTEVVFPFITSLPNNVRDRLILSALDKVDTASNGEQNWANKLLASKPCIPVCSMQPHDKLDSAANLINPRKKLACLYSAEELRFPLGENTYLVPSRLVKLQCLGMMCSKLPDKELLERAAKSLPMCTDNSEEQRDAACKRAAVLLKLINEKTSSNSKGFENIRSGIRSTKFLPVMHSTVKSDKWQGADEASVLLSPDEVFPWRSRNLLCYVKPILDEASIGIKVLPETEKYLGLSRQISFTHVMEQLQFVIANKASLLSEDQLQSTKSILHDVYRFLQKCNIAEVQTHAADIGGIILVDRRLACPEQVSMQPLKHDCSPYLFNLPAELHNYADVFHRMGMRDQFSIEDIAKAMLSLKGEHGDRPLEMTELDVSLNLATLFYDVLRSPTSAVSQDEGKTATTASVKCPAYLPDTNCILRIASTLCFNDCEWLQYGVSTLFVNDRVPPEIARRLGVRTKRQDTALKISRGIPFGQKENLTKRIRRIMSAYPWGKEIFKELVQNADDAGATVIHFVRDARNHPTSKLFDDCWKPLQGPALCVFNNKPFSKRDLEGIQSLGDGSKGTDSTKTGQYGVGFNSVYHLTDAPSFITKGSEIGEKLCIFDPHCVFVPGATIEEPGRLYEINLDLRRQFPDVFAGYLDSMFDLENSTVFRFPLRNADMAKTSKLSDKQVTPEEVTALMSKFKSEMFEALLFVSNISEIHLSDIPSYSSGANEAYSVSARLSKEDAKNHKQFLEAVDDIAQKLKSGQLSLSDVTKHDVSYRLTLADNTGYTEEWFIQQRIGFENPRTDVSPDVAAAFSKKELCLLPRGGIASLLSKSSAEERKPGRVFCFLPLPVVTNLPVHVNGHFALDHEARRGLWKDDSGGARTEWNVMLLEKIIAPLYIQMLCCRRDIISSLNQLQPTAASGIPNLLREYIELFPPIHAPAPWGQLNKAIYQMAASSRLPLLPLLLENAFAEATTCRPQAHASFQLKWLPISTEKTPTASYFNTIDSKPMELTKALLNCGLHLLNAPLDLASRFEASGVTVCKLEPGDVLSFLASSSCLLRAQLPSHVSNTLLVSVSTVKMITTYCQAEDHDSSVFWSRLEGLPFSVSQANVLRLLSSEHQLFASTYHDLVPGYADFFLHEELLETLYRQPPKEENSVLKVFRVEDLGECLQGIIPEFRCEHYSAFTWHMEQPTVPNRQWLQRIWKFLAEQCMQTQNANEKTQTNIDSVFKAIRHWALIPAIAGRPPPRLFDETPEKFTELPVQNHRLVRIEDVQLVVDLSDERRYRHHVFRKTLRSLGVLELDIAVFMSSREPNSVAGAGKALGSSNKYQDFQEEIQLLRRLTANLDKPFALLKCIKKCLESFVKLQKPITLMDGMQILHYFCEMLNHDDMKSKAEVQSESLKKMLKDLPVYVMVNGLCTALNLTDVYLLPESVPPDEFEVWSGETGVIFLKKIEDLQPLYKFIGCQELSDLDVYDKFIFSNFTRLSSKARISHMEFIRERTIYLPVTSEERASLVAKLRKLRFIDDANGSICTADQFYAKENPLFKLMLDETKFLPKPFSDFKWKSFIQSIGFNDKAGNEIIIQLAEQIEKSEAQTEDTAEKSKALIAELFQRSNLVDWSWYFIQRLKNIRFIKREQVNQRLTDICDIPSLQHSEKRLICFNDSTSDQTENVCSSWSTTVSFLPYWADPIRWYYKCVYDEKKYKNVEAYKKNVLLQLGIVQQPTLSQIVGHLKNLCKSLPSKIVSSSKHNLEFISEIMRSTYDTLERRMQLPPEVIQELLNLPFILVGRELVRADQLVLNIEERFQIKPYIQRAPSHHKLLLCLGSEQEPNAGLYAKVLGRIYDSCKGTKLDQPTLEKCYLAVHCLFNQLSQMETPASFTRLFLPSQEEFIVPSNILVYNDEPAFAERLSRGFDQQYLVELSKCHLQAMDFEDGIRKLPTSLKPRMLFDIVQECIESDKVCNQHETLTCTQTGYDLGTQASYGAAAVLMRKLRSKEFKAGLLRLIWHEHSKQEKKPNEADLSTMSLALQNIHVYSMPKLVTHLMYDNKKIEGSEAESECFVSTRKLQSSMTAWDIYMKMTENLTPELLIRVAEIITKIARGLLYNSVMFLHPILSSNLWNIPTLLDKLRIRHHDASGCLPASRQPGYYVPCEVHYLLCGDTTDLHPGDSVVYELHDPLLERKDGEPAYIYAVIVGKEPFQVVATDHETRKFQEMYKIDIGETIPSIVSVLDLYSIKTKQSDQLEETRLSDQAAAVKEDYYGTLRTSGVDALDVKVLGDESYKPAQASTLSSGLGVLPNETGSEHTNDDLIAGITVLAIQELRCIFKLHGVQLTKALKRFMLKFLQDMKFGNQEIYNSWMENMSAELVQLQVAGAAELFQEMTKLLRKRAMVYSLQHSEGSADVQRRTQAISYRNRQPAEAFRWYRQAEKDLRSAMDEARLESAKNTPAYEWVGFKCHQVAEKAMKGALFTFDSRPNDMTDLRLIACSLDDAAVSDIAKQLQELVDPAQSICNPDRLAFPRILHQYFSREAAEEAVRLSRDLLNRVRETFLKPMGLADVLKDDSELDSADESCSSP